MLAGGRLGRNVRRTIADVAVDDETVAQVETVQSGTVADGDVPRRRVGNGASAAAGAGRRQRSLAGGRLTNAPAAWLIDGKAASAFAMVRRQATRVSHVTTCSQVHAKHERYNSY